MAYPYYAPTGAPSLYGGAPTYQQYNLPTPPPSGSQSLTGGLVWVQGENGAKSYIVPPNSTMLLMDSESQKFYLKSVDGSGMPRPLRVFEYSEVGATPAVEYVTKAEFEKAIAELSVPKKAVKKDE